MMAVYDVKLNEPTTELPVCVRVTLCVLGVTAIFSEGRYFTVSKHSA
jgi:hypothetical protein